MKGKRLKEVVVIAVIQTKGKAQSVGISAGIDAYEIADPVDIFNKFNEAWTDKVLGMEKWMEKKEEMEELVKTAGNVTKMLGTGNFWPVV